MISIPKVSNFGVLILWLRKESFPVEVVAAGVFSQN